MSRTERRRALEELREAAADRRVHARLLEDLIAWAEDGCDDDDEPNPDELEGVSFDVGVEMVLDVRAIYLGERAVYPLAYPAARRAAAARPRRKPQNLYEMMKMRGML